MDSMAIYRGMDIGTAKPDSKQQETVAHHLIDLVEPEQDFTVAEYVKTARDSIVDVQSRNRTPIFVGGTGLYLRALLRGVFDGPAADLQLRAKLEEEADRDGLMSLHRRLSQLDPEAASRLHPNDRRRVIRAIEVVETTGLPISEQQQQPPLSEEERPRHVYWLSPPRPWLHDRVNRRVDLMIDEGLEAEVRALLQRPAGMSQTARQALGYKEFLDQFEGTQSLEETIDQIKTRTRQFAKRQHTWFRNLEECREIGIDGSESPTEVAEQMWKRDSGS